MTVSMTRKLLYSYYQMPSQDLLEYIENLEVIHKMNIELNLNMSIATSSILTNNIKKTHKGKTRASPDYDDSNALAKYLA